MKIKNQNIYGGNQQYADLIINSKGNILDENDKKFLQLIHENTETEKEREELINSLNLLKDDNSASAEKEKSKGLLKKFIESGVGEVGKQVAKEMIENGVDYLKLLNL